MSEPQGLERTPEQPEIFVARDQDGFFRLGKGGGEAVGVRKIVLSLKAGGEPGQLGIYVHKFNGKRGSLLELGVGRFLPMRPPDRVISLAPVDHRHQQGPSGLGGLVQKWSSY